MTSSVVHKEIHGGMEVVKLEQVTEKDIFGGTKTCLELGCQVVVVTLGEGAQLALSNEQVTACCYIRDANSQHLVPSRGQASSIDTTGAGDAFAAGFLYGLLNGRELEECGQFGDIVAQFKIAKTGARDGLPTFDELDWRYRNYLR